MKGGQRPFFASGGSSLSLHRENEIKSAVHLSKTQFNFYISIRVDLPSFPFFFFYRMQMFNSSAFAAPRRSPPIVVRTSGATRAVEKVLHFIPFY